MTRARNSANLASHGNLFVDIANDRTGIGSVAPAQNLHVAGTAGFHADVTFTGDSYNTTWDRSDNSLKFVDHAAAKFGGDNDIIIRHDPSMFGSVYNRYDHYNGNVWFVNRDTTNKYMYIRSNDIQLRDWTNNFAYIHCKTQQGVDISYNNVKKFETTAYGTNTTGTAVNDGLVVAGIATVTTMNVTGVLTYDDVTSVDSVGIITARQGVRVPDGSTGANYISAGASDDIKLYHDGNTASVIRTKTGDQLSLQSDLFWVRNSANSESIIKGTADGAVELYHNNLRKLSTISTGIKIHANEANNANIFMTADDGDDNGDQWIIQSQASSNNFNLYNDTSGTAALKFSLKTTGNLDLYGDLFIPDAIVHTGDTDTKIVFTDNQIDLQTGGSSRIYANTSAVYVKSGFPLAFLASSGPTPNIKSGGTNNQDLLFTTGSGNPTRLEITNNGNVLIGRGSATSQEGDGRLIVYANTRLHPAIKADCIDGGTNRANGYTMLADNYGGDESLTNIGVSYSGGGLVLSRGVKVSNTTDNAYLSSVDSFATQPCALKLDNGGVLTFLSTNTSATTTTDSAVTLTERFRIKANGRTSVGANDSNYGRLQVNQTSDDDEAGFAVLNSGATRSLRIYCDSSNNAVFNSGNAGSGQINFNEGKVIIDSSGRVMIGTPTEGHAAADNLTVADTGNSGITIRSGTSNNGALYFSDGTSGSAEYKGAVRYSHSDNALDFYTNGTTRLLIDSGGTLTLKNNSGMMIDLQSSSGTGSAWIEFSDTDGTRKGYLGYGSGSSEKVYWVQAKAADMAIYSNGYDRFNIQSNGTKVVRNGHLNINSAYIDFSGDVSTPSTAAAIFRPADNTLAFSTANTERFRIQSNGRVLIGPNSASEQSCSGNLDIVGDNNSNGPELYLRVSNNNTTDNIGALLFGNNVDKSICMVRGSTHTANNTGDIEFHTSVAGTMAEKVRIYAQMGVSMQTNNVINNSGNQQNGVGYGERTRIYPYWVSDTGACRFNLTFHPSSSVATPQFWVFTNATNHLTGSVEIGANSRTNSPNNAVQRMHHSKWNVGMYGEGDNDFSGSRWRDSQMTQKGNTIDQAGGYYYVHSGHSQYNTNANQYQNGYGGWYWHLDNGSYWQGQKVIFDMYFSSGGTSPWYAYIDD